MKKILFLINTLGIGGAERVLVDIVNNLNPKLFDITIQTIYDINYYRGELNPEIKYKSYFKYFKKGFLGRIYNKLTYLKIKYTNAEKLYNNIIKVKYDIEIAFLEGLPTKIISASTSTAKKIAWVHTDMYNNRESLNFFKDEQEEYNSYKQFAEIYTVSENTTNKFKKRFKNLQKVYTIENIIDEQRILSLSKENINEMNEKYIFKLISVGRLEKIKGYDRLIDVFSALDSNLKEKVHLYIIGDGSQKSILEHKINQKNLSENITLLGYHKNPYKYIKNADLYICSSYAEGSPLVILESLLLKTPILSTDCGVSSNLLSNGKYGVIVENNTKALIEKLEFLIKNPEIVKQYKNNLKKNINLNKNIEKIEKVLLGEEIK